MDHDILEVIHDFQNTVGPKKNIQVNVKYIMIQTRNMDTNEIFKNDKNENKSV